MKLNVGIVAHGLPAPPEYLIARPDQGLVLSDIRFFRVDVGFYDEDILYFVYWEKLCACKGPLPSHLLCVGGGACAASFFKQHNITGMIAQTDDPLGVFGMVQSIFLRYNQLENALLSALNSNAPTRDVLTCCAEFFQNQVILYDGERNLIDYSAQYLPGEDDRFWKEILETGKRPKKMVTEVQRSNNFQEPVRTPYSDFVVFGPGYPNIMTHSFFENGKRLATLTVVETNKPLSACQLKVLDYIAAMLSPNMFHIHIMSDGKETLRSVFVSMLRQDVLDPLVVARCLHLSGWDLDDDFVLISISVPEASKNAETLTRYRHIYERLFPDSIAFKYKDGIVVILHNDTGELMKENLPKLEKQLVLHDAAAGLSFPFKGIMQLAAHYMNADIALHHGDKNTRLRKFSQAAIPSVISRIAADIPLYPMCHREAIRIFEYDLENGTELLLTLETYLMQYKSLKAAAEELFIHRSTMTYRLGCIEKITRLAMDDPKERLHLLLSSIVLRTLGHKQQYLEKN